MPRTIASTRVTSRRSWCAATREQGGLFTMEDLANWKVKIEEPVHTNYKGIEVYKLTTWVQGPVMLQALNILENFDLKSMGYDSARYIHTLYQAMNLAFADRDFYYGDPALPAGARRSRACCRRTTRASARSSISPTITIRTSARAIPIRSRAAPIRSPACLAGSGTARCPSATTAHGAAPSSTAPSASAPRASRPPMRRAGPYRSRPSGGWMPAVIAGHTGVGLSQRMQSFVLDANENPFNVLEPGKRPRATLTPTLALKDGKPYLVFSVQGGDTQDQNLLQFFLNVVEFGMTLQEATEAANITSYQMRDSFGRARVDPWAPHSELGDPAVGARRAHPMGYKLDFEERSSGPINAIVLDRAHGTMWGGSSNHGEDYGIGW